MATYYSGDQSDIQLFLKAVNIGEDRLSSVSPANLASYQAQADAIINMRLAGNYYVPLRQISEGGVTKFPDAIKLLAILITCQLIYTAILSEVEPNLSNVVKQWDNEAELIFNTLINGAAVGSSPLKGQRLISRNRFQNPRIAPKEPNIKAPPTM
jgi:hypothetical protein